MKNLFLAIGGIIVSFVFMVILFPILIICGIVLFFSLFKRGIEID
ncbi:MAG: hypothetical protein WC614_05450 [bacterium]